jgi:hypothetical protein
MAWTHDHPLMFAFRDVITGDGFLAGITVSGRCLMVMEGDEYWMYGVRPGGLSETADSPQSLLAKFRRRYKEILFDIADECRDFESFEKEVKRFFLEPDSEEERRWEDAVSKVRSENLLPPQELTDLPKESPETRPSQITIERLDGAETKRFMPTDNVRNTFVALRAA